MTLKEVMRGLHALPDDHTVYADRIAGRWTAGSPATVAAVEGICSVAPDGGVLQVVDGKPREYLLDVREAKDVIAFLQYCLRGAAPSEQQQLDAIIYYGENRGYLPVGRYYDEEYAEPIEMGVEWDTGAPLPVLLANDYRTLLAFYLRSDTGRPTGLDVHVRDPVEDVGRRIAVVEFEACRAASLGLPDLDALRGHRLWRRGLRPHGAFVVRNSTWAAQLRQLARPRRGSPPAGPDDSRASDGIHYLLSFRDSTFECVAGGLSARVSERSMARVMRDMAEEILTGP